MKAEYVNSFYKATGDVFQLMLGLDTKREALKAVEEMVSTKEVSAVLGVTGALKGTIIFSFSKSMALEMVKIMSGMEMDSVDSFVSSALGEVANIIAGNAMTHLAENSYICDIVPPKIFIGEYKSYSDDNEKALLLTLVTSIGEFDINIFLREK